MRGAVGLEFCCVGGGCCNDYGADASEACELEGEFSAVGAAADDDELLRWIVET